MVLVVSVNGLPNAANNPKISARFPQFSLSTPALFQDFEHLTTVRIDFSNKVPFSLVLAVNSPKPLFHELKVWLIPWPLPPIC